MKKILLLSIVFFVIQVCVTSIACGQGVGVNPSGNPPDPSAIFDASATDKGMLIPRLTTVQRNAIASPAQALLIYNTTTKCFETYEVGLWQALWCSCSPPSAPATGTHVPSATQIVWNWNFVSGATGYKWSTANDYGNATDNGPSTSYT